VIPEQNRELVEVTTHPEALDAIVRSLGPVWQKHQIRVSGKRLAATGLADLNIVDRRQCFGDYSFKETDLPERISARLGESDRRAIVPEPLPLGPFGGRVRELTLPGWLTRRAPKEPELAPTQVEVDSGTSGISVQFAFGPLRFVYDRLGLRPEDHDTTDASGDLADA
jgi:CRISPR-associated endonuclease/helicase Cas3